MSDFFVNGNKITSNSSWRTVLKKRITPITIQGDIESISKFFPEKFTTHEFEKFFEQLFQFQYHPYDLSYILKNGAKEFKKNHYLNFINWINKNPKNRGNEYIMMLYIDDKKSNHIIKENQKKLKDKFSKYYTVEYWMNIGFNEEEAQIKISEYKSKKSTKLINFISKYGKIKGTKKFENWKSKCINTIDSFKKRYGNNWEEKWHKYTSKDSSSWNWALNKSNGDLELAKKIFEEKVSKTTVNLDRLIKEKGEIEGRKCWEQICSRKDASSLNYYIQLCNGNLDKAKSMYESANIKKDSSSLSYFMKKYPENPEIALLRFNEKRSKSDCCSLSYFLSKYDFDDIKAKEAYLDARKKRKVKHLRASAESMLVFGPIYSDLIRMDQKKEYIYVGASGHTEMFLTEGDSLFFYDFCLISKKKIIEFNGKAWHPNWEKYNTLLEIENNFKFKTLKSIKDSIEREKKKIETAKRNGFDVLILWEEDGIKTNLKKAREFLSIKDEN